LGPREVQGISPEVRIEAQRAHAELLKEIVNIEAALFEKLEEAAKTRTVAARKLAGDVRRLAAEIQARETKHAPGIAETKEEISREQYSASLSQNSRAGWQEHKGQAAPASQGQGAPDPRTFVQDLQTIHSYVMKGQFLGQIGVRALEVVGALDDGLLASLTGESGEPDQALSAEYSKISQALKAWKGLSEPRKPTVQRVGSWPHLGELAGARSTPAIPAARGTPATTATPTSAAGLAVVDSKAPEQPAKSWVRAQDKLREVRSLLESKSATAEKLKEAIRVMNQVTGWYLGYQEDNLDFPANVEALKAYLPEIDKLDQWENNARQRLDDLPPTSQGEFDDRLRSIEKRFELMKTPESSEEEISTIARVKRLVRQCELLLQFQEITLGEKNFISDLRTLMEKYIRDNSRPVLKDSSTPVSKREDKTDPKAVQDAAAHVQQSPAIVSSKSAPHKSDPPGGSSQASPQSAPASEVIDLPDPLRAQFKRWLTEYENLMEEFDDQDPQSVQATREGMDRIWASLNEKPYSMSSDAVGQHLLKLVGDWRDAHGQNQNR
jgi:hypothetical protein